MVNFPTSLDNLQNPTATNQVGVLSHSQQHRDANDILEALEAKVGADGSAVQTSHDYKLGEVTGSDKAVGKSATQTLLNKTLTSPSISDPTITGAVVNAPLTRPRVTTSIDDANGNEVIKTPATASAVNEITVTNSATGQDVQVTTTGDDTNVGLKIKAKGTGRVKLGTAELQMPNTDGANGQVLKTDGAGNLSFGSALSNGKGFGVGSDGEVILDGVTTYTDFATLAGSEYTLTRDMFPETLTVESGISLKQNGYGVWASNSIVNEGTIHSNGGDGGGDGGTGAVGTAGVATSAGTFSASTAGVAGGESGLASAVNGIAGISKNPSLGSNGVAGGNGATGGTGGVAGTATGETASINQAIVPTTITAGVELTATQLFTIRGSSSGKTLSTSAGSGSGAGDAFDSFQHNGAGSGATGGIVFLASPSITNSGTIQANGGNGGSATRTDGGKRGGGGGGGSGGVVALIYETLSNTGTIEALGGTGGTGGNSGANGLAGKIYKAKLSPTTVL